MEIFHHQYGHGTSARSGNDSGLPDKIGNKHEKPNVSAIEKVSAHSPCAARIHLRSGECDRKGHNINGIPRELKGMKEHHPLLMPSSPCARRGTPAGIDNIGCCARAILIERAQSGKNAEAEVQSMTRQDRPGAVAFGRGLLHVNGRTNGQGRRLALARCHRS